MYKITDVFTKEEFIKKVETFAQEIKDFQKTVYVGAPIAEHSVMFVVKNFLKDSAWTYQKGDKPTIEYISEDDEG